MARIRSIKPELRTSLVVAEWPREVRYFFTLLWGYLDDHGRGVDNARLVLADCFPLDRDLDENIIDSWLDLIAKSGPLCRYSVGDRHYLHSVNWKEHQKPSHPTDTRIPDCPFHHGPYPARDSLPNSSRSSRETLANVSGDVRENFAKPAAPALGSQDDFAKSSGGAPELFAPEQLMGEVVREVVREVDGSAPEGATATKPRPTRGTSAPDHFEITDSLTAWAHEKHGLSRTVLEAQTERFLDHHRAKGTAFKDWNSAWRSWMGRVNEFGPRPGSGASTRTVHQGFQNPTEPDAYSGTF